MTEGAIPAAWPFEEAQKLVARYKDAPPAKGYVLFETGYGPSGLPHIGTFMEVFRTTLVRQAFAQLSDIPTKLFAVSDDMDGLRKVPDNIPNPDMVRGHLGLPLTKVPDPFGTHESYGAHMNARLCGFLDQYGFNYEFISSTAYYQAGKYDEKLLEVLKKYDEIQAIMLPTLGDERASTYSPFMPICPKTGHVLQVPIIARDVAAGTITYRDDSGEEVTVPVTGGHCKLQWKPDFGMRWAALDVDYEMYGKDHQASAPLYSAICKTIGGRVPEQYVYEMFLDAEGKKISKSKGNGISLEEWLRYAPPESLSYYLYLSPRKAKRLYFDVIPKAVDEYQTYLEKYQQEDEAARRENPVWHIHGGNPPAPESGLSFGLLLNLASAAGAETPEVLWGFISRYQPGASAETHPFLAQLVQGAVHYYEDFIKPTKRFRTPTAVEAAALEDLKNWLEKAPENVSAEDAQQAVYDISKNHPFEKTKEWFACLYETLLGQPQGPRMGSFIALYGTKETAALIDAALAGKLAA